MIFEHFAQTDPGLVRKNNEDSVAIDRENQVLVLADGMGGYNAGEVASAMATSFVKAELGRWMGDGGHAANSRDTKRAMETCVENANRAIFNAASANPQYAGMGTTLVMAIFQEGRALIGHLGDSRCYRLRGGRLEQITHDHSLLQEQIDAGLLAPEQAQYASHKNLVTRALGVQETVLLEVKEWPVQNGDLYLLCSDGLNDMLPEHRIAAILAQSHTLEKKAHSLIDAAKRNGGRDNISVILTHARGKPAQRGLLSRMLGQ